MDDDKKVDEWLENHDGQDYCHYCIYSGDCREKAGHPEGTRWNPTKKPKTRQRK